MRVSPSFEPSGGKGRPLALSAPGFLLICLLLLLGAVSSPAADRIWTGASGADSTWSTAANWKDNTPPGNRDAIIFDSHSVARLNNCNTIVNLGSGATPDEGINIVADSSLGADVKVRCNGFTLNANGIANLSSHTLTIGNDFIVPASVHCRVADGPLVFTGAVNIVAGDLYLDALSTNPGTSHVVEGIISGAGGLRYSADGPTVCEIRAGQGYAGDTVVSTHGTLRLVGVGNLPSGTTLKLEDSDSTFDLNGINQTVGHLEGKGRVLLGGATLTTGGDDADSTFQGVVSGNGNLVKNGSGTFTLGGANTYTGLTVVNAGTLATGASERLPDTGTVVINGGSLRLGGGQETIGSLSGAGAVELGGATLITGGNHASTTYAGVISGGGGLSKQGGGTFTLSGANTYTGATTAGAGVLRLGIDNALPAATTLQVEAGACFDMGDHDQSLAEIGGKGSVSAGAGTLTVTGSLSPGGSVGRLTLDNFVLAAGATMTMELNGAAAGTGYDQVVATGDVTLAGSLALSLGTAPSQGQSFTLIDKTSPGAINGTFRGLEEGAGFCLGSHRFRITYRGGDGNDVVITCVGVSGSTPPAPAPTPSPRPAPSVGPGDSPRPTTSSLGPCLGWPKVPAANFYRIYRAPCPTCPKQQVGRVAGTSFTDTSAQPDRMYYYFIRTENPGGLSGYSDWIPAWRYQRNPGRPGDFDGDGVDDLLWWESGDGRLRVWLVSGERVQGVRELGPGLEGDRWLLAGTGDFDRDGVCDVVWWDPEGGRVQVWYGGDPAAAVELGSSLAGNATLVRSGDLDGDGAADLLWCDYTAGRVTVWIVDAGGGVSFAGAVSLQQGCPARRRGGADLDGGEVSREDQPGADDLPGMGDIRSWQVAGLGDVDGDGRTDVVWRQAEGGRLAIWFMAGAEVRAVDEYLVGGGGHWRLGAVGDLDGDGRADLVWQEATGGAVRVWLLDAGGGVSEQRTISLGSAEGAWRVEALGDFDPGGGRELFCRNQETGASRAVDLEGRVYELAAP